MDLTNPIVLTGNYIASLMICLALYFLLTPKKPLWICEAVCLVFYSLSLLAGRMVPSATFLRLLLSTVLNCIPVLFLFSDPPVRKLCLFLGIESVVALCEMISILLFGQDLTEEANYLNVYIIYLCFFSIFLALFFILVSRKIRSFEMLLNKADVALLCFFLISQIIITMCWEADTITRTASHTASDFSWEILVALILFILQDCLLVVLLRHSSRSTMLQVENATLTQYLSSQKEYYSRLAAQYEIVRIMRHDIANHLFTVKALVDSGRLDKAQEYTQEISDIFEKQRLHSICENPAADSFLSARMKELSDTGITVETELVLPASIGIDDYDLISAFGNMLDNAAEAADGCSEPEIRLAASMNKGFVNIRCENPVGNHAGKTVRIPGLPRGIGTIVLNSLAEKYDGSYSFSSEDGKYISMLSLKSTGKAGVSEK